MPTLNNKHKELIVKRLACYNTVKDIQEEVRELFNDLRISGHVTSSSFLQCSATGAKGWAFQPFASQGMETGMIYNRANGAAAWLYLNRTDSLGAECKGLGVSAFCLHT